MVIRTLVLEKGHRNMKETDFNNCENLIEIIVFVKYWTEFKHSVEMYIFCLYVGHRTCLYAFSLAVQICLYIYIKCEDDTQLK